MTVTKVWSGGAWVELGGGAAGALVDVEPFPYPPMLMTDNTLTNQLIDAAGEKTSVIFYAPKSGEIDRVCFRTQTVTTGATVDVRLETVDTSGFPTGTLADTNSNASQVIASADDNTWFEVTLTASATVTEGQALAIVIVNASPGVMNISSYNVTPPANRPVLTGLYTGTWANTGRCGVGAVRYNDGTYPAIPGILPITGLSNTQFGTGSTPDERANKFTPDIDCKVGGATFYVQNWAPADTFDIVLYDTDGSSVLESASVVIGTNATTAIFSVRFDTQVTLAAGSSYWLAVKPTSANTLAVQVATCNATARAAMQGSSWDMHYNHRTDAGAWTPVTGDYCCIQPIITALADTAA